jgi:hypothetical protein
MRDYVPRIVLTLAPPIDSLYELRRLGLLSGRILWGKTAEPLLKASLKLAFLTLAQRARLC